MSATWTSTGNLSVAVVGCGRVKLTNGNILFIGGYNNSSTQIKTCQLFDKNTHTWSLTGDLGEATQSSACILLNDGTVLKAGGNPVSTIGSTDCEIYDPVAGTWSSTGSLNTPRWTGCIFKLTNGHVLLTGGITSGVVALSSTEIYDPIAKTWSTGPSLPSAMGSPFYGTLGDGRLILASSNESPTLTTTFNGGAWITQATCPFAGQSLENNCAINLPNGDFLVLCPLEVGGIEPANPNSYIYHYLSDTWETITGPSTAHMGTAALLQDGTVLLAGGEFQANPVLDTAICDIYNPTLKKWTSTTSLPVAGVLASSGGETPNGIVLDSGKVLWAGQFAAAGPFASNTSLLFQGETPMPNPTSGILDNYNLRFNWGTDTLELNTGGEVWVACPVTSPISTLTSSHIFVGNGSNVATDVALSGDATLANTGALTLATVNSNVGSFTSANITVDAKGRITAAANGGGSALPQVFFVSSTSESTFTGDGPGGTFTAVGPSQAITLQKSTNKVKVTVSGPAFATAAGGLQLSIFRGTTNLAGTNNGLSCGEAPAGQLPTPLTAVWVDTPGSVGPFTYQAKLSGDNTIHYGGVYNGVATILVEEILS